MLAAALGSSEWAATWPAAWALQALALAVVAQFVVEAAIATFGVKNPLDCYRLRLAVLFAPIVLPPLAQLVDPSRGSFYFRLDVALLDVARLADLTLVGLPIGLGVLALFVLVTSGIVVRQELWPVLRHRRSAWDATLEPAPPAIEAAFRALSERAGVRAIPLQVVRSDAPVSFATARPTLAIVISTGLIARLDPEALQAALAHELAHVLRRSSRVTTALYAVRLATFFSPVSLLVFRRLLLDEEHVCDDVATRLMGSPAPLARALERLADEVAPIEGTGRLQAQVHGLQLRERIARLRRDGPGANACGPSPYLAVGAALALFGWWIV